VVTADTISGVIQDLVNKINKTDTNVTASFNSTADEIVLTAKFPGAPGGLVTMSVTSSTGATILGTASNTTLNIYLENPAQIAPGTLIQVLGNNLCDSSASADFSQTNLPLVMNNCILYVDGVRAPLLYVSPTQINAQMPLEFSDRTSVSLYLRTTHADGTVTATTPIATTIVPQNPGLFALGGQDPRPGILYHASSQAFDIVDFNGLVQAGDTATIQIGPGSNSYNSGNINVVTNTNSVTGVNTNWTSAMVGGNIVISGGLYTIASVNSATSITLTSNYLGTTGNGFTHTILYGGKIYSYTETATDTINSVTTAIVAAINAGPDPYVYAVQANEYNRMILYAYTAGPAGENIPINSQSTTNVIANTAGSQLTITVYNPSTCCDAPAGLPVTQQNPAIPGEALYTFATGIGPTNPANISSGFIYRGGNDNPPAVFVDSILCQGLVATPMNVALVPDTVGIYYVEFALNSSLSTNSESQLTIAQQLFVSNVVTFPIVVPGTTILPPTVSSVYPNTGSLAGGNAVTLTGANFIGAQTVTFAGANATSFTVNSSTSITAVVPAGSIGPVSVVVTTLVGSNAPNTLYSYVSTPVFTSLSPQSGPMSGGTTVTITGSGFTGATGVTFAGVNAQSFTVVNDTTITAVSPVAFEAGLAQVDIVTPGGTVYGYYTYNAATTAHDKPSPVNQLRRIVRPGSASQ
jgi:uncharacterized protein (TIGR03437 family)